MSSKSIQSLVNCGSKIWLDSVDPEKVKQQVPWGITGATSNPIIVSDIIKSGAFDQALTRFLDEGLDDEAIAWQLTDMLVTEAQKTFQPFYDRSKGDDGYVSFELDPLLEDPTRNLDPREVAKAYIELGTKWAAGHTNRMIKVPNTAGGRLALEELVAAGVTLNVTLTFTEAQYIAARDAVWRGAQRRSSLDKFKSVYSIFVSRVDVYTNDHVPELSKDAQGMVGIVNAKRIWKLNQDFWADKGCPLNQEIIFASTGRKFDTDPHWRYVGPLAGSDIQTNPPATNEAIHESGQTFTSQVGEFPPDKILNEIDAKVDVQQMEDVLMSEGVDKFVKPQNALLKLIAERREAAVAS